MAQALTITEIKSQFEDEWILVENPRTDSDMQVEGGQVVAHSKDRDEVYRHAVATKPKRFAIVYTGSIPEGTAIVL